MGWRGAAVLRETPRSRWETRLDRSATGALVRSLTHDPHPMVRGAAAWALGRVGSPQALRVLRERANARTRHIGSRGDYRRAGAYSPGMRVQRNSHATNCPEFLSALAAQLWSRCRCAPRRSARAHDRPQPKLHSYSAMMHAHVALTSFPFLSAEHHRQLLSQGSRSGQSRSDPERPARDRARASRSSTRISNRPRAGTRSTW